jgi:hypothetical protein
MQVQQHNTKKGAARASEREQRGWMRRRQLWYYIFIATERVTP